MQTVLVPGNDDPLKSGGLRCAGTAPVPVPARIAEGRLEVDEALPKRLRERLAGTPHERLPPGIVLAPAAGVDPLGPDPYLQSTTFLTAAAALEAGLGVGLLTRGVPARGFDPLFRRYPGKVVAHVAVSLPDLEPDGAALWPSRLASIAALAGAGVPTWLRIEPSVPSRTDSSSVLGRWIEPAASAGARGVVVAPLVLDEAGRELVDDDPAVLDYYRPGRRRRRGMPPAAPVAHLPLEREAALLWRVRRLAEDFDLPVRLCRCARAVAGSCGLAAIPSQARPDGRLDRQLSLWAG